MHALNLQKIRNIHIVLFHVLNPAEAPLAAQQDLLKVKNPVSATWLFIKPFIVCLSLTLLKEKGETQMLQYRGTDAC